ncbi:alpha/beta fold hydrolase [Pseudalkalibacillus salsuginis]|uniref:alpha/beta fold hydrolase n=1 Tax=Pseudalkalibacillus salsuginis TaxID=2910972 RepID=UPI001F1822B8|nr:alpha/beta hydrolase [Pseudalkalibacillus salsuginis]MCF6408889.1 alpha/beta hydrolase [Pseudalkalibacillus salsuginis]
MTIHSLTKSFSSTYGKVSYDVKGNGAPLVLVHGTPWSSFNWRHIIPGLSQWFTVYYYDLIGYGDSEKGDRDVSLGIQNKVLKELLDFWCLNNPFVIGHDFGGTTVLRTHLVEEQAFEKIILIDPVAISPWGSPFFSHVNKFEAAFQGIPEYIHEAIVSTYVQGAMYKDMDTETLNGIKQPWLGSSGQEAFYRQIAQAHQKYTDEIEPMYSTINKPVLIMWGEEDTWIPIKTGHKLHGKIKSSEFVSIPHAGHLVQEDQPSILISKILKFLLK